MFLFSKVFVESETLSTRPSLFQSRSHVLRCDCCIIVGDSIPPRTQVGNVVVLVLSDTRLGNTFQHTIEKERSGDDPDDVASKNDKNNAHYRHDVAVDFEAGEQLPTWNRDDDNPVQSKIRGKSSRADHRKLLGARQNQFVLLIPIFVGVIQLGHAETHQGINNLQK